MTPIRRRTAALTLTLATLTGTGLALAPAADANATYSAYGNCFFSTFDYTHVVVTWERSSSGGSRKAYTAVWGDNTGVHNDEEIAISNFWQSYTRLGPAVNSSYIQYWPGGTYGGSTPAQPASRMPYVRNRQELHLDEELTRHDGAKCHISWKVGTTGATLDR